tara:strand:- start:10 stop:438 length:429 start_codon:yes stop_codon:yes gene_type:complete
MASILKVDTITGVATAGSISVTGEGNSTTTNLQQGLAKAWATFNADGTPAFRDSFNSSTLTDNGTGDMTISYTNSFNGAGDYTAGGQVCYNGVTTTSYCLQPYSDSTIITTSTRYSILYNTASAVGVADYSYCSTINQGDLA